MIVPQPIENLVAKRVFVMEYIEGKYSTVAHSNRLVLLYQTDPSTRVQFVRTTPFFSTHVPPTHLPTGFKITDTKQLSLYKIDKEALMARVCQAYNCQFFADGFFNADPHAGNLMVSVKDGTNERWAGGHLSPFPPPLLPSRSGLY